MSRRLRLPWEKDPNDKEANYQRPIPQHEKIRLTAKGAAAVAGFLFVMSATRDGRDIGADFLIGIGGPLVLAGWIDLLYTLQGRLEHVFIESRPLQLATHGLMALVGVVMVVGGVIARSA